MCNFPDKSLFITHKPPVDMLMKIGITRDNSKVIHTYPQVFVDIHWFFIRLNTDKVKVIHFIPIVIHSVLVSVLCDWCDCGYLTNLILSRLGFNPSS